jgi:ubiquinone/menaquinone biosynthesis C-methylase UbiE
MNQWLKIERIPSLLASSYEKATRLAIDIYYRKVAEEIVSSFKQGVILDLGTGPGYLPIEIVKKAPDINVFGIDLSRKLIRMARANASKAGLSDKLNFETGNAAKLQFEDGSFDMVISTGMLHSLRNPVKVLKEIYRVLKNDGNAWIFDPAKVADHVDRNKWKASLSYRERFSLWLFTTLKLLKPIKTYSREEIIALIEPTDFKEFRIEEQEDEIKIKLRK